MRGQKSAVVAVRRPDGGVVTTTQPLPAIYQGWWRKTPLLRGIIALIEALVLGVKTIIYSANVSLGEDEEPISGGMVWGMLVFSVALAGVLFTLTPLFLTRMLPLPAGSLMFNLVEGLIRLAIFIAYLKVTSFMPDIRRVFAYHGAEHKAVNALEDGAPLEVTSVRGYSTANPRCGTSFLFIVMVIAILAFSIVKSHSIWVMLLSRIVLIPLIAALGYEVIYFAARHAGNGFVRLLLIPGLKLQALTTREPDDSQLEVALTALRRAVELDQAAATAPAAP